MFCYCSLDWPLFTGKVPICFCSESTFHNLSWIHSILSWCVWWCWLFGGVQVCFSVLDADTHTQIYNVYMYICMHICLRIRKWHDDVSLLRLFFGAQKQTNWHRNWNWYWKTYENENKQQIFWWFLMWKSTCEAIYVYNKIKDECSQH